MGKYFNPGNSGFERIKSSGYVDKTGLAQEINQTIDTTWNLTCISRPRRFGKSYAAQMLCAYYDCTCDSHQLFSEFAISKSSDYEKYLNQYNVLYLDITGFISDGNRQHRSIAEVPLRILKEVRADLVEADPELAGIKDVSDCILACIKKTNRRFIFIIDEWDAVIREAKNDSETQKAYLNLLRSWFKNGNFTPKAVAAAYMTGILPIKKDGTESAISDFREYSILYPGRFVPYTGFEEWEVAKLCQANGLSFSEMKSWYDGYDFPGYEAIYNPYSVMCAVQEHKCRSYWRKTTASESLMTYINMDFDGLQEMIARLLSGEAIEIDTDGFENDFEHFRTKDDVMTLLVHLGYLTYHEDDGTVRIPNEEVRIEFAKLLQSDGSSRRWAELLTRSKQLLADTLAGKEERVADAITAIRDTEYAPTFYNDEQALRYVVKFAYVAAIGQYLKVEELPSGHGIADIVYIPKKRSPLPALIIELKWNKTAEGAIAQIKDKKYPSVIKDYGGDLVLVGINYHEDTKIHTCKIERIMNRP